MQPYTRLAFTLVELLVVIAIVVVLLALLTPALDKAIYQAELVVCATSLRTIGNGSIAYALGSSRAYPDREWVVRENFTPDQLTGTDGTGTKTYDSRPALRTFISLNASLNDVLGPGKVDIATPPPSDIVDTGWYQLWLGYQFQGEQAMRRIGDRWTFTEQGVVSRFSVLATDALQADPPTSGGTTYSSHSPLEGGMAGQSFDHQTFLEHYGSTPDGVFGGTLTLNHSYTFSRWIGPYNPTALFDNNFAMADGSVGRLDGVTVADPRMSGVGVWPQPTQPTWRNYIPAEAGN